tara:strand:- start:258 stop:1106 length:849 start_codon:yes stop_codon:yes gene_type:complete
MIVGSLVSLFNVWRIKSKLKLEHALFSLNIKDNSELIILGTSSSVNEISPNTWSKIQKSTTVGINYFLFNDFVPDIIQLEIKQGADQHYFENLLKILSYRESDFKNSTLLIKSNFTRTNQELIDKIEFLKKIPEGLKRNLRFCIDFPVPALTSHEYRLAIRAFNFLGLFKSKNLIFTPHLRASIGLTAVLANKYNFKEIIFVGIDLNHRKTFYDKKFLHKEYGIFFEGLIEEGVHLTNDPDASEVTIVEVLNFLRKEIKSDMSYSVLSKKSALRKIMPLKQY